MGTPQYMSPEQALGAKLIDARSDLYSLGVVAYQMLAGRLPFEADSAQGMIVAHIMTPPDPIDTAETGVPEEMAAVVMRALAKKPDERWGSAAQFADAMRLRAPVSIKSTPHGGEAAAAATQDSASGETVKYARTPETERAVGDAGQPSAHQSVRPSAGAPSPVTVRVLEVPVAALVCTGTPQLGCGLPLDQFSQIPAGTFQMGSNAYCSSEQPVHSVTISRAFYMQKTEVTQGQWRAVMGSNPSYFSTCGDTCPVEQVSWDDITTFLQRLNAQTPGVTYRLPTEAEWEYAARAGTTGETYGPLDSIAWYEHNSASKTHAVAGKQANAWGLYDMIGNVFQWVNDWYGSYSSASVTDPTGPATGTIRVLRGGSWGSISGLARAAYRHYYYPSNRLSYDGFRLVRTP